MNNRIYLDIHAIQTVPPSNINRDDTGSPKTAQYGGVRRARVSSQSWKRAIRNYFVEHSEGKNVGVRSLNIVDYIAKKIEALDETIDPQEAHKKANDILNKAGVKTAKDKNTDTFRVKALFFIGDTQAQKLAQAAVDGVEDKKILQDYLKENPAIDIALFGRMVADDPSLNEDASSQVAHAISTHAVQTEFDFFTALDDLAPEDNAGAGMLGTIEYNSSTLYRYANVAVHELYHQLGDDVKATTNALQLFIEAFSNSLPTGKVNTFANQTLPQAILVSLRTDRPVNLVSAFEKPVRSTDGYVDASIQALYQEYHAVGKFVEAPKATLCLAKEVEQGQPIGQKEENLQSLIQDFGEKLESLLTE